MINLKKLPHENRYRVSWDNGVLLGYFVMDVDGFYYFELTERDGLWSEYSLRQIAGKLEELNAAWVKQIQNDLRI